MIGIATKRLILVQIAVAAQLWFYVLCGIWRRCHWQVKECDWFCSSHYLSSGGWLMWATKLQRKIEAGKGLSQDRHMQPQFLLHRLQEMFSATRLCVATCSCSGVSWWEEAKALVSRAKHARDVKG